MNEDPELLRVFSNLLLVGDVFTPAGLEDGRKELNDLLNKCGFSVIRSECTILDKSQVGESTVTIAKYSIEYRKKDGLREKPVYVEGGLAMEADRFGNLNISIFAKSGSYPAGIDAFHTEGMLIRGGFSPTHTLSPRSAPAVGKSRQSFS